MKKKPHTKTQRQNLFWCLRVNKNIYETCQNIWNHFLALGCDRLITQFIRKEDHSRFFKCIYKMLVKHFSVLTCNLCVYDMLLNFTIANKEKLARKAKVKEHCEKLLHFSAEKKKSNSHLTDRSQTFRQKHVPFVPRVCKALRQGYKYWALKL